MYLLSCLNHSSKYIPLAYVVTYVACILLFTNRLLYHVDGGYCQLLLCYHYLCILCGLQNHRAFGVNNTIELRVRVTLTHKRSEFHSFKKSAPCGNGFTPILE